MATGSPFRRLFTTTRGRLTLVWIAIFAGALAIADASIYLAVSFAANGAVDSQLRSEAVSVAARLTTYPEGNLPHETAGGLVVDLAAVGEDYAVLEHTPEQPLSQSTLRSLVAPVLQSGRPMLIDFSDPKQVHRRAYVMPLNPTSDLPAVLVASTPLTDLESSIRRTMLLVGLLSLLALAGSAVLVHWVIGRVLRPVSQIANLAESLSERDLHRRVEVRAPADEVGQLVSTFNRMLARLETSFAALRSFTADASHELRSPLALMATELEYALDKPRPAKEQQRVLHTLQQEVRHMSDMVEKLLMLARVDAGELKPERQRLDVIDFIHVSTARWVAIAGRKGVDIEVDLPESGTVVADPSLTRRILDNLIDNALRHSPTGGRVRVSASRCEGGWLFAVSDQGPGIAPEQRAHVFERFARADSARSRKGDGGTGLGLTLSLAFARAQGGDLRLAEAPGWGGVFQVWLADDGVVSGE